MLAGCATTVPCTTKGLFIHRFQNNKLFSASAHKQFQCGAHIHPMIFLLSQGQVALGRVQQL
eukprot:5518368-Karenia_brevis.AAC.1